MLRPRKNLSFFGGTVDAAGDRPTHTLEADDRDRQLNRSIFACFPIRLKTIVEVGPIFAASPLVTGRNYPSLWISVHIKCSVTIGETDQV